MASIIKSLSALMGGRHQEEGEDRAMMEEVLHMLVSTLIFYHTTTTSDY